MSSDGVNPQLRKTAERLDMEPETIRKRLMTNRKQESSTDVRDRKFCPECGEVGPRTRTEESAVKEGKFRCKNKECKAIFDTPATAEEAERIRVDKDQRSLLEANQ